MDKMNNNVKDAKISILLKFKEVSGPPPFVVSQNLAIAKSTVYNDFDSLTACCFNPVKPSFVYTHRYFKSGTPSKNSTLSKENPIGVNIVHCKGMHDPKPMKLQLNRGAEALSGDALDSHTIGSVALDKYNNIWLVTGSNLLIKYKIRGQSPHARKVIFFSDVRP
jgi:hypothetical protein